MGNSNANQSVNTNPNIKSQNAENEPENIDLEQTRKFNLDLFRKECLDSHNQKRNQHGVKELKRNSEIDKIAQGYAEKIAKLGSLSHGTNKYNNENLGENLYMQGGRKMTGSLPVESWYNEIEKYNFNNPRSSDGVVGHFTQVVWKGSRELGIGCSVDKNGSYWVVANYYPAGNFIGEEKQNVFPK